MLSESFGFEEAVYRTAADRAYLASVLLLADVLHDRFGIQVPRSTKFYNVIEERAAELDPYLKEKIAFLRVHRNTADYDLELTFSKNDARHAIARAKGLMAWLSEKFC